MSGVGSLFSGYGGLDLALEKFFGLPTAWVSEVEPAPTKVLAHRFPSAPNLGDITQVDWSQVAPVSVIGGGSPCQDLSVTGKRAGMFAGTRSGLWGAMQNAIDVLRPEYVVWENVKGAFSADADGGVKALDRVIRDLATLGYVSAWGVVRASDAGAPHRRERVFVLARTSAYSHGVPGRLGSYPGGMVGTRLSFEEGQPTPKSEFGARVAHPGHEDGSSAYLVPFGPYSEAVTQWLGGPPPALENERLRPQFVEWMMGLPGGWVTDVPGITRAQILKMLGNAVVPQQALLALQLLYPMLEEQ